MNNVFTAKLLQSLRNKKGEKGFTLIELLVVVIIIGVLAAIALPNLLGQVARGREAEAATTLGAINRAQQSERLVTGSFQLLNDLPIGIVANGQNYVYADECGITASSPVFMSQTATAQTDFQNDVRDHVAAVSQDVQGTFVAVLCANDDVDGATAPIPAIVGTAGDATTAGTPTSCDTANNSSPI